MSCSIMIELERSISLENFERRVKLLDLTRKAKPAKAPVYVPTAYRSGPMGKKTRTERKS